MRTSTKVNTCWCSRAYDIPASFSSLNLGVHPHGSSGLARPFHQERKKEESSMGSRAAPRNICLTMHQPWASLLVAGVKRVEGRSWPTEHRGILWIHAAAKEPSEAEVRLAPTLRTQHRYTAVAVRPSCHHYDNQHLNSAKISWLWGVREASIAEAIKRAG